MTIDIRPTQAMYDPLMVNIGISGSALNNNMVGKLITYNVKDTTGKLMATGSCVVQAYADPPFIAVSNLLDTEEVPWIPNATELFYVDVSYQGSPLGISEFERGQEQSMISILIEIGP